MASIVYLVHDLVDQVRIDSDLALSQVYDDSQLATVLSDAGSSLRDIFTGTNQYYDVSTFDFTLQGGVGLNSVVLPQDFQQGHSIDINPDTQQPFTLRYLPNWLNRNSFSLPFQVFGNNFGPKAYTFLGSEIVVLPAVYAQGTYRLYYTPTWTPLALANSITVDTVAITVPVVSGHTGFTAGLRFLANDLTPADIFLPTDVGNFITVSGAVNSGNNGSRTIGGAGVISGNEIAFSVTTGLVSETLPDSATVVLSRASNVTAAGTWTFYGASEFTQTTGAISVGDTITVSGAANGGNNGTFTVLSVGFNSVTTATTGLVTENFITGTVTVTSQPLGTRSTLPQNMNPWIQYIKTQACITVRRKRGQPVGAFEAKLAADKDRIATILQDRKEEPNQPPLLRGNGSMFGDDGWGNW